jgi:hypothetical protein
MSLRNVLLDAWEREIDRRERNRAKPKNPVKTLVSLVLVIIVLIVGIRVYSNYQAKDNPPASCQLLGGTWNIWDGWRC